MTELKDLMEYIDYFFEPIRSTYNPNKEFEVYLTDGRWTITPTEGEVFGTTNHEDALGYLIENKADLAELHDLIFGMICTKGTLKRLQLRKIEELVGKEAIDENEKGWEEFTQGLAGMIEKEVNKPKLEIV